MKWIPISERLPEKDTGVLIHIGSDWFQAFWDGDDFWKNGKVVCGITHWLEITGPEDCCEWKFNDDEWGNAFDDYVPSCGGVRRCKREFKTFLFCPHCGRKIKEVK